VLCSKSVRILPPEWCGMGVATTVFRGRNRPPRIFAPYPLSLLSPAGTLWEKWVPRSWGWQPSTRFPIQNHRPCQLDRLSQRCVIDHFFQAAFD
jgi:hypothetical protein